MQASQAAYAGIQSCKLTPDPQQASKRCEDDQSPDTIQSPKFTSYEVQLSFQRKQG